MLKRVVFTSLIGAFLVLTLTTVQYICIPVMTSSQIASVLQDNTFNKPLCVNDIFQRKVNKSAVTVSIPTVADLLTDGEDPNQRHQRDCQLHHYRSDSVVDCLNQFQRVRNKSLHQTLHIAFVGDSTIREQYESFSQVFECTN